MTLQSQGNGLPAARRLFGRCVSDPNRQINQLGSVPIQTSFSVGGSWLGSAPGRDLCGRRETAV